MDIESLLIYNMYTIDDPKAMEKLEISNNSFFDVHISLSPDMKIYLLLDKLYMFGYFNDVIDNNQTRAINLDVNLYNKVIFSEHLVEPKLPQNCKLFVLPTGVYICGYDDLFYIVDVMKEIIYIYDLNVPYDNMHYEFGRESINYIDRFLIYPNYFQEILFEGDNIVAGKKYALHLGKPLFYLRNPGRDTISAYITKKYLYNSNVNNVNNINNVKVLVNDIFNYSDYIVLLTDEYKFIFKGTSKKMIKRGYYFDSDDNTNNVIDHYLKHHYTDMKKYHKVGNPDNIDVKGNNIIFNNVKHENVNDDSISGKVLLRSTVSNICKYININTLLERTKLFGDMRHLFDNNDDLIASLQTEIKNENFEYVNDYYDYVYNGTINKDNVIGLLKICNYLMDVDCNYIVLCMINICVYGNITGVGEVVDDLQFCVECLKLLNSYNYSEFFILLYRIYQNYADEDIEYLINDSDMIKKINNYFSAEENYHTI